jgi:hypothetical protein
MTDQFDMIFGLVFEFFQTEKLLVLTGKIDAIERETETEKETETERETDRQTAG